MSTLKAQLIQFRIALRAHNNYKPMPTMHDDEYNRGHALGDFSHRQMIMKACRHAYGKKSHIGMPTIVKWAQSLPEEELTELLIYIKEGGA